ncbi:hypothetical protein PM082_001508 [Marasmius tenuissimus]|nr:hypothetical protein PM082_001508 [Marasmius tenuissimus]
MSRDWIGFCVRLSRPSRELLADLQNVELAALFLCDGQEAWDKTFDHRLVSWLQTLNSPDLDLTTTINRLRNRPKRFHIESSIDPDESEENRATFDTLENLAILAITGFGYDKGSGSSYCKLMERLEKLGSCSSFMITDCRCGSDADFASSSCFHERYETACLRTVTYLVSRVSKKYWQSAYKTFVRLVDSSLLQHCAFGPELFTQCRILLSYLVPDPSIWWYKDPIKVHRNKLLDWLETCPEHYACEREELKSEVVSVFASLESSYSG